MKKSQNLALNLPVEVVLAVAAKARRSPIKKGTCIELWFTWKLLKNLNDSLDVKSKVSPRATRFVISTFEQFWCIEWLYFHLLCHVWFRSASPDKSQDKKKEEHEDAEEQATKEGTEKKVEVEQKSRSPSPAPNEEENQNNDDEAEANADAD